MRKEPCIDCSKETENTCSNCNKPYCEDCAAEFEICTDCEPEDESKEDGEV